MLNDDQKARLRDRGALHLPGFLPEEAFRPVRERVERVMLDEGHFDGTDWIVPAERPKWPNGGFAGKRIKKAKELRLLDTEDLRATIQDLLDGEDLFTFMDRPQPLFTLNNADEWFLPSTIWHIDLPRFAGCDEPGYQMFTFLAPVQPRCGGTLVVAGSHRVGNPSTGVLRSKRVKGVLKRYDTFADLLSTKSKNRERLLETSETVDGVEVQVVEFTGEPGDVWLMDMRLLHTLAPNPSPAPRLMVTQRYVRESAWQLLGELSRTEAAA